MLHLDQLTPVRSLTMSFDFTGRVPVQHDGIRLSIWDVGRVGAIFFAYSVLVLLQGTDIHRPSDHRIDAFQGDRRRRS